MKEWIARQTTDKWVVFSANTYEEAIKIAEETPVDAWEYSEISVEVEECEEENPQ